MALAPKEVMQEIISSRTTSAYELAGVSIKEAGKFVDAIKPIIRPTHSPFVMGSVGAFGGLFSGRAIGAPNHVLVGSIDGVGTKGKVAKRFGKTQFIGEDIVNHCVNDILCMGASPLFMFDYLGVNKLSVKDHEKIIRGMARAATNHNFSIIGGETAEMPRIYRDEEFDVVGFILGVVEKDKMLTGKDIHPGDLILGLPSDGLHTNGYTLVDKLIEERKLIPDDDMINDLVVPHKSYFDQLYPLIQRGMIKALAHITGGGFDNILRVIPDGMSVEIKSCSWEIPRIFSQIQHAGSVSGKEMLKVFNMGIGMAVIIDPIMLHWMIQDLGFENFYLIGHVVEDEEKNVEFI